MKKNGYSFKNSSKIMLVASMVLLAIFSSCKKENGEKPGSFTLKDNPTSLAATSEGTSQTYTVVADGAWKVAPLTKESWVSIDPMEGNGNGTFTVNVRKNTTTEDRSLILTFLVNEKRPNIALKIEQDGRELKDEEKTPFLTLEGEPILETTIAGITEKYVVRSNGAWKIELPEEIDWVSVSRNEGTGDGTFIITVDRNKETDPRTMDLAFLLNGALQPNVLTINQEPASEDGRVILNEDFNWLNYGTGIFYTSTGEKRMDTWTAEELAKGWTSTPAVASNNQFLVYARPGFVKLGKTSYGGDFISPKLSEIKGTKNLLVKFKAVPYQTKAGTQDDTSLKINIIGPGIISIGEFTIDNWPNYDLDPNCTEAWKESRAERSFTIKGATAETQIRFLGGDFDLSDAAINKNRIFLDDVIVSVKD